MSPILALEDASCRLIRNFARSYGSKGIAAPIVGGIVAGAVIASTFLTFCVFFLLRRCKVRRMPRPANNLSIDETHRSLEEMVRESMARKASQESPYSPAFTEYALRTRDRRISKATVSLGPSLTNSDESHGSSPYSFGPFSPLSPIRSNHAPNMPLPPVPIPSTRFSLVPSEIPHPSHRRQLSRSQSIHTAISNRRNEEPIQEIDAGVSLLRGGVLDIAPPGLPPAYIPQHSESSGTNPSPIRANVHRSLILSDAKAHR